MDIGCGSWGDRTDLSGQPVAGAVVDVITLHEYLTNESVKARANGLMERFGIDPKTCDQIKVSSDGHLVGFHVRTGESWHWVRKFNSDA